MAITATYVSVSSFTVSGDLTVDFVPGVRVRADCGGDGIMLGSVTAASYASGTGLTTVTVTLDSGSLTANLASVTHGNDIPDSMPRATTELFGAVRLATAALAVLATDAWSVMTPYLVGLVTKLLIADSTTIYVATTGSDTTGDGSSSTPYASVQKALSSIANKTIAAGCVVTIQVADGSYSMSSAINIDHPDADKIQIVGNTTAETTVAISSIDKTANTVTVSGDYTSSLQVGDIFAITGSSTSNVNGAFIVSSVSFDGSNTVITCSAETFASSTVGGGSIVIKPCNRCVLNVSSGIYCINATKNLLGFSGFRVNSAGGTSRFCYAVGCKINIGARLICTGFSYGMFSFNQAFIQCNGLVVKGGTSGVMSTMVGAISFYGIVVIDTLTGRAVTAQKGSFNGTGTSMTIIRNASGGTYSPALDTVGNGNSINYSS